MIVLREYREKVAVITGAASGLGLALAKELATRRCNLALVDIDSCGLLGVKQELAQGKVAVTHHCADVGSEESLRHVASEVERTHGSVHLLINNAAISASIAFNDMDPAEFERLLRVNFLGAVYGCRAFLPALRTGGGGQILNVASSFAWQGYPGKTAYACSKAALRGFSESLRLELLGSGVGVTLLYPGPLRTSLVRHGICDSEERRNKEEQFLIRRGISLERAARRSLDRLRRNPSRIVVGFDYRVLDTLARLSPGLASWAMGFGAARAGF